MEEMKIGKQYCCSEMENARHNYEFYLRGGSGRSRIEVNFKQHDEIRFYDYRKDINITFKYCPFCGEKLDKD